MPPHPDFKRHNAHLARHASEWPFVAAMQQVMKKQHGPLSRISGERVPAEDCRCEHKHFAGLKCLCWQRDWGDVPKAITEATVVKPKAKPTPKTKPKAPAKKAATGK
jgi:hypothetical protein